MRFYQNITVRTKLILSGLLPLILVIGIAISATLIMARINAGVTSIYNDRVVPLRDLKVIADLYAVNVIDAVNKANAGIMSGAEARQGIVDARSVIDQRWRAYMQTTLTPTESKLAKEAEKLFVDANRSIDQVDKFLSANPGQLAGKMQDYDGPLYDTIDPISSKITELIELQLDVAKDESELIESLYASARFWFTLAVVLGIILVLLFSWLNFRTIVPPLHLLQRTMRTIAADSNLSLRANYDGQDEIGKTAKAFDGLMDRQQQLVGQVSQAVLSLSQMASEINSLSSESRSHAERQQAETNQVATAMNEMSATVNEISHNAAHAEDNARTASTETERGNQVVMTAVSQMRELTESVEQANSVIQTLQSDSESIGKVLEVIKSIAEQTNLLALNAAIEAARAGEQGRGFAVVADEVRTLAQRTQESTQEIQGVIQTLRDRAQHAVKVMSESHERARSGAEQADRASNALDTIKRSVQDMSAINAQVATAAEEQSSVTDEINRSIIAIRDMAAEVYRGADDSAQASRKLNELSQQLQQQIAVFKL